MTETLTKRRTLLDIAEDLHAIDDLLFETGGDVSDPQVAEAIDKWFAEIEQDETRKVGNYIGLIREKELRAAAITEEAERLKMLVKALGNSAKGLKDRLKFYMIQVDKKKIETDRGNATVCGNGGKTPMTIDPDITIHQVAPCFHKTIVVIDEQKVREHLEKGNTLPWARIEERGTHLRIR